MAHACVYLQTPSADPKKPEINIFTADLKRIGFDSSEFYSFLIDLDPEQEYMLAIDQSTTSTGIALVERSFSFALVMTIAVGSKSIYDRERYLSSLLDFIESMLRGKKLVFVALEEVPPAYRRTSHTYKVLRELKGHIEARLGTFPSVRQVPREMRFNPFPQQWKSTVYDKKEKGKGRFNQKFEIAKDIVKIYPHLSEYLSELRRVAGHDYDGFDAFGMVIHVRAKHFDSAWSLVNRDSKYQAGAFMVFMKYVKSERIYEDFLSHFSAWATSPDVDGNPLNLVEARVWAEDESIFTNFVMAANTNRIACMWCTNVKLALSYFVETGTAFDADKSLYVAVCKCRDDLIRDKFKPAFEAAGFCVKKYYRG